jgi:hypothetical protein
MMRIAEVPDYNGSVVFCDDIRHEHGGKVSHIGVYSTYVGIHSAFPVTLPKFCFAVTLWLSKKIITSSQSFRVLIFLPGDSDELPSIEGEYPQLAAVEMPEPQGITLPPADYGRASFNLQFAPFTLKEPGLIKVRIIYGEVMYRVGTLSVVQLAPTEPSTSKIEHNKFRVIFPEMRIPPRIEFEGLPKGVVAHITEHSNTGFIVTFEPTEITVERFGLKLHAEL